MNPIGITPKALSTTPSGELMYWIPDRHAPSARQFVSLTKAESLTLKHSPPLSVPDANGPACRTSMSEKSQNGATRIQWVDAIGQVVITTPQEVARGDKGVYNPDTGVATLTGSVKLTRAGHQLNGEYGEVNLNTGLSRLLANPSGARTGKRVRGLFMPSEKKPKPR